MRAEIDPVVVKKAYARWAPFYDLVFAGNLFDRGRRAAIAAADRVGGTILEVGVGTGISLADYSADNRIAGVDLSEQMLQKAKARVSQLALTHVVRLEVMDAERLSFPDDSFDVVVATADVDLGRLAACAPCITAFTRPAIASSSTCATSPATHGTSIRPHWRVFPGCTAGTSEPS